MTQEQNSNNNFSDKYVKQLTFTFIAELDIGDIECRKQTDRKKNVRHFLWREQKRTIFDLNSAKPTHSLN